MTTRSVGREGERIAAEHLIRQGYRIVARNWRTRFGEIDIVAIRDGTHVFVEVRTRSSRTHGTAAESVNGAKQRQLVLMAEQYLQTVAPQSAARIDVVTVDLVDGTPRVVHLVGAVDAR